MTSPENRSLRVSLAPWPEGRPFALFLSHDIDQIYDREFFRILGDLNHLRRMWLGSEPGRPIPGTKRVARAILRPREPGHDINKILEIERRFELRSTFFLLEDITFNRLGGRYRYSDPATGSIARGIESSGCEIAVHGAYHNFNDPERYRAQARSFFDAFGREARGIRNHDLRHDGAATWKAQHEAGFRYDASFGFNEQAGIRDGMVHPFFPPDDEGKPIPEFVVLPMTIMDSAIFRQMRLAAPEALTLCKHLAEQIKATEGVLCLNWHNNYFEEEEYGYWQDVYESLLGWLADQRPWNATGEEIADWWMRRSRVRISTEQPSGGERIVELKTESSISGVVVRIEQRVPNVTIDVAGADVEIRSSSSLIEACLGELSPATVARITLQPAVAEGMVR